MVAAKFPTAIKSSPAEPVIFWVPAVPLVVNEVPFPAAPMETVVVPALRGVTAEAFTVRRPVELVVMLLIATPFPPVKVSETGDVVESALIVTVLIVSAAVAARRPVAIVRFS